MSWTDIPVASKGFEDIEGVNITTEDDHELITEDGHYIITEKFNP